MGVSNSAVNVDGVKDMIFDIAVERSRRRCVCIQNADIEEWRQSKSNRGKRSRCNNRIKKIVFKTFIIFIIRSDDPVAAVPPNSSLCPELIEVTYDVAIHRC